LLKGSERVEEGGHAGSSRDHVVIILLLPGHSALAQSRGRVRCLNLIHRDALRPDVVQPAREEGLPRLAAATESHEGRHLLQADLTLREEMTIVTRVIRDTLLMTDATLGSIGTAMMTDADFPIEREIRVPDHPIRDTEVCNSSATTFNAHDVVTQIDRHHHIDLAARHHHHREGGIRDLVLPGREQGLAPEHLHGGGPQHRVGLASPTAL